MLCSVTTRRRQCLSRGWAGSKLKSLPPKWTLTRAALRAAMLSTAFDPLFTKYGGNLPVAFLRALSYKESSQNPNLKNGLMQVVTVARDDYNRVHGTNYSAAQLQNPDLNVKVAADLLNRIIGYYQKHPDPNLKPNWTNPEFVKLLTAGWNSGYSDGGGVGKVASYLESRKMPVTHDNVFKYAAPAGATAWLQNSQKYNWQKSVADLFFQQPDKKASPPAEKHFLIGVTIAVALGLLTASFVFRR